MFHNRTGQIVATLMLVSVSALPITSFAAAAPAPAATTQSETAPVAKDSQSSVVTGFSFVEFQKNSKVKIADAQDWLKNNSPKDALANPIKSLEIKIDKLQDNIKPAGRKLKKTLKSKARPAKGLVLFGERKVSVFGLMLMMAFGIVLFFMSSANAESRLGGRH